MVRSFALLSIRPPYSIRRHLQATSLLAVLAGYVVLLLVNRQLTVRMRHQRHHVNAERVAEALRQAGDGESLPQLLADFSSSSQLIWLQAGASEPPILPSGMAFARIHPGRPLLKAADAALGRSAGAMSEFVFQDRFYFICSMPIWWGGRSYQVRFLDDFTQQAEQERLVNLLLVALAGASALFSSALLRLVIHQGLLPLESFSGTLSGLSSGSLSEQRLQLSGQPLELHPIIDAFNGLLDRLTEAWEHQRTFVNGVSHELRTPITLISGYSRRLLRHCTDLQPDQRDQLQLVASEAESMGRLVNDLLEIARDDAGRLQFSCELLDPEQLIRDLFERLQPTSGGQLQLQLELRRYPMVLANAERLAQCLTNLIDNAIKYSPQGAPVALSLSSAGHELVFHVIDHGPGIPADERQKIFQRFVRGSTSSKASGHGIGLALVQTLMERMGGRVLVAEAEASGGSDFQLRLPITSDAARIS